MTLVQPGDSAPEFSIPNQDGVASGLGDHAGKFVLLWWYPKADTPG